ncbi:solute carrier family 35 member G2-like, putative [Babesia ovata]|uniref:Solute carrier family 35 member G2-like, putative n=1 Tax=Babesia ovata TaxID=189622 RepID=A0A2H6KJB0_9APIC|nr:solute carrier family 35 member G2-like, putative [Babesia ovata]GBE63085.1 solute carrier family 35 member G2-like, putative [Babesia ovata]
MTDTHEFKYVYNYSIFNPACHTNAADSAREATTFLECSLRELRDVLDADKILTSGSEDATAKLSKIFSTFVCLIFPPHSPFVIYDEEQEGSRLRILTHELARTLLNVIYKLRDSSVASSLGLCDSRFMVDVLNLYWRNNEDIACDIASSCKLVNPSFKHDLAELVKSLLERLQKECDHLNFILSSVKQGMKFESSRSVESDGMFLVRSEASPFNRNVLFVDKYTLISDILSYLETVLHFVDKEEYDYVLSTSVATAEEDSCLLTALTNSYYLFSAIYDHMLSQRTPFYKQESIPDGYATQFQTCLFYRCKVQALRCILEAVKYNVVVRPLESADYCYHWLLVFTQIGGDEYNFDRKTIMDDLRDIHFHDYVDEWNSISGTWLPAELNQLKSMVPLDSTETPDENAEVIEFVVMSFVHNFAAKSGRPGALILVALLALPVTEVPSRPVNHPPKKPVVNANMSTYFVPKETRQAVLNYWDFVNRPAVYDDDYDDEPDFEDLIPIKAKVIYDEIIDSSDDSSESAESDQEPSNMSENTSGNNTAPASEPKSRQPGNRSRDAAPHRGRGSRGGNRRQIFNRKRNTINLDAFG